MATKSVIAPDVLDKKGYYRLDIEMVPNGGREGFKYSIAVPGWRANSEIEFTNKNTLWDYTKSAVLVPLTKEEYSDMIKYEPLDDEVPKEKKPRKPRVVKEK
jgi:hypothetical protein